MADWTTNTIMEWGGTKLSDHGRQTFTITNNPIQQDKRMVDGTLRRHFVKNKRSWSTNWQNLPTTNAAGSMKTADGRMSANGMETFYAANPGKFRMVVRRGTAISIATPAPIESALPYEDANFYICNVMITEFTREVVKRGPLTDLVNITVTLEEV